MAIGGNLQKLGNELLTICCGKGKKFQYLHVKYVPHLGIPYLTALTTDFFLSLYLFYYILRFKPDVVYYRGVTLAGSISRIFKVASVAEANGIYPDEVKIERPSFFKLFGNFLKLREWINYYFATRIICVTEGIRNKLGENYGIKSEVCTVIPNGVNTDVSRPMDKAVCKKKLGLAEDCFYVGFVGFFRFWQGLNTLIEAMKITKDAGYNEIHCVLVGDGGPMGYLRKMVEQFDLEEETVFTGKIEYKDVATFINSFDICYLSKIGLNFGFSPLKLYEYLACARPVIASRVQGVTEVIEEGKCGYLFEPHDPKDLAFRIMQSYEERGKLRELGHNGRIFVEKNYNWAKIAKRVEIVLKEAIEVNSRI